MKKIIFTLALFLTSTANAAMDTETFIKLNTSKLTENQQNVFNAYMNGVVMSLLFANAELGVQQRQEFFCPPPNQNFNDRVMSAAISNYLLANSDDKNMLMKSPVELVAIRALEYVYPCK